jgi:hypothetical protein
MGFNDTDGIFVNLLAKKLKIAVKKTKLENNNIRIWLVTGSGGILMSLHKALPNAYFVILLTGGQKYKDIILKWCNDKSNIEIIKNEQVLDSDFQLYYSSVTNYDSLIWYYVKKYGKNNDYIWNVASEDYIF